MKKSLLAFGIIVAGTQAFAADLPRARRGIPAQVMAPVPIAKQSANLYWTGGYIGGHLGYGFASKYTGSNAWEASSGSGLMGGLQAGYDWQFDRFVAGIAADASLTGINAANAGTRGDTDWQGSLRGRLGFLATDRLLVYGTAGLALGGVKVTTPTANERKMLTGFTVGAGAEYAFTQNLSSLLEYRYTTYGRNGYGALGNISHDHNNHTVRAGLNYRF